MMGHILKQIEYQSSESGNTFKQIPEKQTLFYCFYYIITKKKDHFPKM